MRSKRSLHQAEAADLTLLARRLEALGLHGVTGVEIHANRTVLVSVTRHGILRIHRGFAYASDRVLKAVVLFVSPASTSDTRREAEALVVGFPVERYVPSHGRQPKSRPGDREVLERLIRLHDELNRRYFDMSLSGIQFRLSGRMRTRLGELTIDPATQRPREITLSRLHVRRDGWDEVSHTVLHEMVHQWQVESGKAMDHGPTFRRKAREVGIEPRAVREVVPE